MGFVEGLFGQPEVVPPPDAMSCKSSAKMRGLTPIPRICMTQARSIKDVTIMDIGSPCGIDVGLV